MALSQLVFDETGHQDIIYCLDFDYYGRRLATCGADKKVHIFNLSADGTSWVCVWSWRAHNARINSVKWALPHFGQVIITASSDRTVCFWREPVSFSDNSSGPAIRDGAWILTFAISDALDSVQDVALAPRLLGSLTIATVAADGLVRVYETTDSLSDLTSASWFPILPLDDASPVVSVSYPAEVVAAASAAAPPHQRGVAPIAPATYAIDQAPGRHAPPANRSGQAATDGAAATSPPNANANTPIGACGIAWLPASCAPDAAVVVGADDGSVRIYTGSAYGNTTQWTMIAAVRAHFARVLSVRCAPSLGRSYSHIATCGYDGLVCAIAVADIIARDDDDLAIDDEFADVAAAWVTSCDADPADGSAAAAPPTPAALRAGQPGGASGAARDRRAASWGYVRDPHGTGRAGADAPGSTRDDGESTAASHRGAADGGRARGLAEYSACVKANPSKYVGATGWHYRHGAAVCSVAWNASGSLLSAWSDARVRPSCATSACCIYVRSAPIYMLYASQVDLPHRACTQIPSTHRPSVTPPQTSRPQSVVPPLHPSPSPRCVSSVPFAYAPSHELTSTCLHRPPPQRGRRVRPLLQPPSPARHTPSVPSAPTAGCAW